MNRIFDSLERPKRLSDEVAYRIQAAIAAGRFAPGDRLPTEHGLARQFGVARTVVREAISLLKYDGVIATKQGVGAFVADRDARQSFRISPACFQKRKQLLKFLQLRTSVQSDAAALAAAKRSKAQIKQLAEHLEEMSRSLALGDAGLEARIDSQSAFYRVVTEASGNEYFVDFIAMIEARLMDRLRSVVVKNAKAVEWGTEVLREHEAVFRAIKAGAAEKARAATRLHFDKAAKRLADRADIADV